MGLPIYRNSPCAEPHYKSPPPAKHDAPPQARSTIRRRGLTRHPARSAGSRTDAMIEAIANAAGAENLENNNSEPPGREVPSEIAAIIDTLHSRTQQTNGVNDASWHPQSHDFEPTAPRRYNLLPDPRMTRFRSTEAIDSTDIAAYPADVASSRRPDAVHEPPSARFRPRRQATIVPDPTVNGLGDRLRSFSPEVEGDQWDTLLATITPDPSLPSASSSFASAQPTQSNEATSSQLQSQGRRQDNLQPHRGQGPGIARFRSPLSMATPASESAENSTRQNQLRSPSPVIQVLPYPEPSLGIASPSNTSDSEEAASLSGRRVRVSREPRNGRRDYVPPTRSFWPSDSPMYNTVDTANTSVGFNAHSSQLRANHTAQLHSFNLTYRRYMAWNHYTDRRGLEISPDVDIGMTNRSLSGVQNLLRQNLSRQEQYLRDARAAAGTTAPIGFFDDGGLPLTDEELAVMSPSPNLPSPSPYSDDPDEGPGARRYMPRYRG